MDLTGTQSQGPAGSEPGLSGNTNLVLPCVLSVIFNVARVQGLAGFELNKALLGGTSQAPLKLSWSFSTCTESETTPME